MRNCLLLILAATLMGCSSIRNPTLKEAAVADTITTRIALNNGFHEANPIGFPAATVAKIFVIVYTNTLEESPKKHLIETLGTSVWTGAAINNTLLVLGVSNPISIVSGILGAIAIFQNSNHTFVLVSVQSDTQYTNHHD
jgi:hypothetical protein